MLLWFFDSWLGGKVVMEAFKKKYPHIDMILEMDREHAPYGGKTWDEIRELTRIWVGKLFARWADVVILACNTASVHALRWLQKEVFIGRHILWVTVPWAEAVIEWGYKKIWVLATEATVRIRAYKDRVHILDDRIIVEEIGAPGIVPLIEAGNTSWVEIETRLEEYLWKFSPDIEVLVLGCTHYPLIRESIEKVWKNITKQSRDLILIDPGEESAKKFEGWLEKRRVI